MRYLLFLTLLGSSVSLVGSALGQSTASVEAIRVGIALSKLAEPVYPPLARTARINGDVELKLGIRKDGTVASAVVISGHPMLAQAALQSAQQSQFECRACLEEITYYPLIYSFQFATNLPCDYDDRTRAQVVQSGKQVTITAVPARIRITFSNYRVRAAKCLYLWRCGYRWGGEDHYYYRVHSPQCLYLWRCGLRRRSYCD
jgi:TonB family protein